MELLVQTAAHELTKDPEEDVDPPSAQGGLVVFDSEKAACLGKKTYKGPYLAMKEVVAMLLGVSNKSTLSIACVPNQYAIVRAVFSTQSPLQIATACPKRLSDLDGLLSQAAELATSMLAEMIEGWKQNLVQLSETNATKYTTREGTSIHDLWNWDPSKLTYRAFSVKDGEHVPSYVQDFLGAFMARKKGALNNTTKENPLSDHPFVKDLISKLLAKRDGAVKKGAATISKGEKRHRHPCIGPLEIQDYRLHERTIVAASGGCEASRAELEALFPGQLGAVMAQHGFEMRFVRLCDLLRDALFSYTSNTEGNIFGDDHVGLRGIWCLTSRQYYKGGLVESTNTKETWYLNFLNRLMSWDDQSLKGRLYQPHDDSNTTADQRRRHSTTKTMDAVFLQISARVNGWVQCELISKLLPFYLDRMRAFQHSQLLPAMKREEMCKFVGVCRNTLDSFDDLLTPRVILTDKAPPELTSWKTPGSITEQLNIDHDALILSIVVLGREEAKRVHGRELLEHGIDLSYQENEGSSGCSSIQLVDTEANLGCMADEIQTCKTIDERISKAEDAMSEWLALRQRCDGKTLLARIGVMRKKLQDAVENAAHATHATKLVKKAYHRFKKAQENERNRISDMDTDADLTVDERCTVWKAPDREQSEALSAAIDEAFETISTEPGSWFYTFKESIAMTVGRPPYFNWDTTDGSEETAVPQSRHVEILKRMNSLLELYKNDAESNTSATSFIDLVSPMEDYVGMMTTGRFSSGKGEEAGDWVGFKDGGGSLKMNKRVVDWLETRISTMTSCPTQFLDTIAEVSYNGFLRALSWAGVFSEHNMKIPLAQKPHLGLSVVYVMKVLAVAAVNDALYFSTSAEDHADAVSGTKPSALFVVSSESKRIDMVDISSIKAFAKTSTEAWKCVCAIASFTEALLTYNRDVKFNADCWEPEWAKCVDFVPLSFCAESFLVLHDEQLDEFTADKNSFLASMCKNMGDYPESPSWSFSDTTFTTPEAFRVLLTWLPRSVHYKHGFFQMAGVRERPDFENGFLNVKDTLPSNATATATQYWDGFCTHSIASTHGRLPTPPPPSAASAAGSSEMHSMQSK
jgi:hypothetical protein